MWLVENLPLVFKRKVEKKRNSHSHFSALLLVHFFILMLKSSTWNLFPLNLFYLISISISNDSIQFNSVNLARNPRTFDFWKCMNSFAYTLLHNVINMSNIDVIWVTNVLQLCLNKFIHAHTYIPNLRTSNLLKLWKLDLFVLYVFVCVFYPKILLIFQTLSIYFRAMQKVKPLAQRGRTFIPKNWHLITSRAVCMDPLLSFISRPCKIFPISSTLDILSLLYGPIQLSQQKFKRGQISWGYLCASTIIIFYINM